jgi:hypothetical protein
MDDSDLPPAGARARAYRRDPLYTQAPYEVRELADQLHRLGLRCEQHLADTFSVHLNDGGTIVRLLRGQVFLSRSRQRDSSCDCGDE